jgi:hypothetical protein
MARGMQLQLALAAVLVVLASAQPYPGPAGIEYDPAALPTTGLLSPAFPRCNSSQFYSCLPNTTDDLPVTYLMQAGPPYVVEQVKLVPADPDGRWFTVTFVHPNNTVHEALGGTVLWGYTNPPTHAVYCSHQRYSNYPRNTAGYYVSGGIYRCVIGPMQYGRLTVYYTVRDPDPNGVVYNFTTYPQPGSLTKLGLIADLGQTGNSSSTLDNLKLGTPDLIMLAGDLCYADDYGPTSTTGGCVHFNGTNVGESGADVNNAPTVTCGVGGLRWDSWGRLVEKTFAYYPTTFVAGNHELEIVPSWNTLAVFTAYNARIPPHIADTQVYNPAFSSIPQAPHFYSINIGQVHVLAMGSYDYFQKYSDQWNFVQDDLGAANRSVTPWIVAFLHAPWYNTDVSHYLEGESMRVIYEPFLYKAGVDIVQAGHVHAYERSYPVYKYKLDACGPTYMTVGDAGNLEGVAGPFYLDKTTGLPPFYSAYRDYYFGHAEATFTNSTFAQVNWFRNIDGTRVPDDSFTLASKYSMGCV